MRILTFPLALLVLSIGTAVASDVSQPFDSSSPTSDHKDSIYAGPTASRATHENHSHNPLMSPVDSHKSPAHSMFGPVQSGFSPITARKKATDGYDYNPHTDPYLDYWKSTAKDFKCTGAEYYRPTVNVDCRTVFHGDLDWEHLHYYIEFSPAGLAYSDIGLRRWADFVMESMFSVLLLTEPIDFWTPHERNNWGKSLVVHFRTMHYNHNADETHRQVKKGVEKALCASAVTWEWKGCVKDGFYDTRDPELLEPKTDKEKVRLNRKEWWEKGFRNEGYVEKYTW